MIYYERTHPATIGNGIPSPRLLKCHNDPLQREHLLNMVRNVARNAPFFRAQR
jgi:hypothetical protein